jgi:hypothetical protein
LSIKLSTGEEIPIEMHKARKVQKIQLVPVDERLRAIEEARYNTFLLKTARAEPPVPRFFLGKLRALDNWGKDLAETYKKEMGLC